MQVGKYSSLLRDPQLKRWHANLARGSPTTAEVALRRLGKLCELLNLSPKQMVAEARKVVQSLKRNRMLILKEPSIKFRMLLLLLSLALK